MMIQAIINKKKNRIFAIGILELQCLRRTMPLVLPQKGKVLRHSSSPVTKGKFDQRRIVTKGKLDCIFLLMYCILKLCLVKKKWFHFKFDFFNSLNTVHLFPVFLRLVYISIHMVKYLFCLMSFPWRLL